jgi:hypothetical protein
MERTFDHFSIIYSLLSPGRTCPPKSRFAGTEAHTLFFKEA